jgi:serine phosphatase RsbU (regulator of sigma subunit)
MALRVLSYQDHLEREIALRTAEIQSDLALAREFQQALLPHDYPAVGGNGGPGGCGLQFHHLYRPAASLSGDFFDVLKLSENRVGVFVADVMGHGTRSALVTAILRTLLPEVARSAADPGDVLAALNARFVESLDHTGQKVFVSGIYLVADVEAGTVRFASAGHPSPLVVNRSTGTVSALFDRLRHNPALGLFPGVSYETFRRPLLMTDLFVFYTDGVVEAVDDRDEEFGRERLEEVMSRHRMADAAGLAGAVGTSVSRFLGGRPAADDICLVVMEVLPSRGGGTREAPGRS